MNLPKAKKIDIQKYEGGLSKLANITDAIKLSANESALGCSPNAKKAFYDCQSIISKYPDTSSQALKNKISEKFNLDLNNIIIGSGSDEIISFACQAFLNPGDEVVVSEFGFLMYKIYSKINGANVVFAKENNYKTNINTILDCISDKTKLVFIANPNNPTGTFLTKDEVLELRKKLRSDILLLIDDAYCEYVTHKDYLSGLDLFKKSSNVLVTRTFSKIYGLANLRIGWGFASKEIIDALSIFKPPFNITGPAEQAAVAALDDDAWLKKNVEHNTYWSNKIFETLSKKNITCNLPLANFFLMRFENNKLNSDQIFDEFAKNKIILRKMHAYKINNALRVTVGSKEESELFIQLVDKIL